jgi:hypothetical protein
MTGSELRAEHNIASGSSSCSYTDGAQYGVCETEARGWPMPQYMSGGRKRSKKGKTMRKRSRCSKKCSKRCSKKCKCKCHRGGKSASRRRKGGFLTQAAVPFGLFAAQKRTQRKHAHAHGRKHKSYRRRR